MAITRQMARKAAYRASRTSGSTSRFKTVNRRTTPAPSRRGGLLRQVRALQRAVNNMAPEIKYVDHDLAQTNIPTTGAISYVTAIPQGDTQATRTGNTINISSFSVRGFFAGTAADMTNLGHVRVALVQDRQQVADTAPTAGAIFADGISTASPVMAMPAVSSLERFKVLYLGPALSLKMMNNTTSVTSPPTLQASIEFTWKGNIKTSFNGAANTDIEKNGCWFVILSDNAGGLHDFVGVCRTAFTDA